jgi:hypothetical protein
MTITWVGGDSSVIEHELTGTNTGPWVKCPTPKKQTKPLKKLSNKTYT